MNVSFKIWFYLGSSDRKYVLSQLNFLWKQFCFKVWDVKASIQKLTGDKMVVSYSDTLQKSRLKFWRFSKKWPEVGLVFFCFYFLDLRQDAFSRNWLKTSLELEVLIRELSSFSSKKVFLWIMIFRKSRKCQLSRFYGVYWHQKLILCNRICNEFCSPKIKVFLKSDAL